MTWTVRARRNLKNLAPAVRAMLDDGTLPLFDAEWIGWLPEASQHAAAVKAARDFGVRFGFAFDDRVRSTINTGGWRGA